MLTYRQFATQPIASSRNPRTWITAVVVWTYALCAWLGNPGAVAAQTPPIDVNVDRMYTVRSEAPITLRVQMMPRNPALVEGRLEFRLLNNNELLSTVIAGDEIINPPSKIARYVLPGPEAPHNQQVLDLYVDFVTPQGRYKFDPIPINVPKYGERDFIVGVMSPANKTSSTEIDALQKGLKLENFTPVGPENAPIDRTLHTYFSNFAPEQLPADGTSFCSFNMVFIAAEGFSALKESQWPGLLDWVEAGGSLCLMPGTDLTAQHIDALNKLVKQRSSNTTFLPGPNNEVVFKDEDSGKRHVLLRRGLGRIAIVPIRSAQPIDPNSEMWRSVAAHLWNVRRDQMLPLLTTGKWNESVLNAQNSVRQSSQPQYDYYRSTRDQQRRLAHLPINSGDFMVQSIMPSDLRIIPLSLIAFILFLYVLAIGPADYFILGRLKMRKWTWVTFPVTTILFAGGALWMAEWYMNTGDARRSIYLVDIGVEGNAERTTQLEMLFNSRQRIVETHVKRGLFTPLNHQDYGGSSYQSMGRQRGFGGVEVGSRKPEISGRIPSNYTARQLTPKWVPQLNRITSVLAGSNTAASESDPPEKEAAADHIWPKPDIDWKQFELKETPDWAALQNDAEWKKTLTDAIKARFPSHDVSISVCGGGKYIHLHGTHFLFQPNNGGDVTRNYAGRPVAPVNVNGQWIYPQSNFITDISMLEDGGLFGVVSAIAPHGGRQFEDLTLVDPSDPRQWLLIVGLAEDTNWIIYRKLFAGIE